MWVCFHYQSDTQHTLRSCALLIFSDGSSKYIACVQNATYILHHLLFSGHITGGEHGLLSVLPERIGLRVQVYTMKERTHETTGLSSQLMTESPQDQERWCSVTVWDGSVVKAYHFPGPACPVDKGSFLLAQGE